ncbi:MAG: chemotaxis protein CheC [Candidatus Edwardsbacteria bacterium]|nr:chemotaxis protein CheC [Candidatus Edwardsbacteria bacterium]
MASLLQQLTPVQQDALKEVFNIGSGQSATTLSEVTGQKVMVSVPMIGIKPVDEVLDSLAKPGIPVVSLVNIFAGDISGATVWLMPGDKAKEFAEQCWHHMPQAKKSPEFNFGQIHREISEIMTTAYLNAVENMLNLMTVPSTPLMLSGVLKNILGKILAERTESGLVAYVQDRFTFGEKSLGFSGFFMMMPDADSLKRMLEILKVAD